MLTNGRSTTKVCSSSEKLNRTAHDVREMELFGIEPTFRRRFKFVAMVGFASTVVMCWQNTLATFSFALQNGGTGGYFFTYIYGMFAFAFTYLSLAELSSSWVHHSRRILNLQLTALVQIPNSWWAISVGRPVRTTQAPYSHQLLCRLALQPSMAWIFGWLRCHYRQPHP